jgi:hypothetical protein
VRNSSLVEWSCAENVRGSNLSPKLWVAVGLPMLLSISWRHKVSKSTTLKEYFKIEDFD